MTRNSLLAKVTALPHTARFRALHEAGVASRTKPGLAAELDGWEKGDWQERLFCVQACTGSKDTHRLRRMVQDPSRWVSSLALLLLADFGDDQVLLDLLDTLSHRRKVLTLRRLRKRARFAVIDRFLQAGFTRSVPRTAEMLHFGSAKMVRRHLRRVERDGCPRLWRNLAWYHPRLAVAAILDRLTTQIPPDALLLANASDVLMHAGRKTPEAVHRLARVVASFLPLARIIPVRALRQCPDEFATILLETDDPQPLDLLPVAHRLDPTLRLRILREQPAALPVQADWLRRLSVADRQVIFRIFGNSWRNREGFIPVDLLACLPAPERVSEAERISALPELAARPCLPALYAGYLPWPRLRECADHFLSNPDGEWRGWGWEAIGTGLRYHQGEAATVLAMIRQRKQEQDPVRVVILQQLAALPGRTWKESHLDDLTEIIRASLDAADLSRSSVLFLSDLAQKQLGRQPVWAVRQLASIYRERGHLGNCRLGPRIGHALAIALETEFLVASKGWGRESRVGWLLWFASALGHRLAACARLLQQFMELLKQSGHYQQAIIVLLRRHLPHAEFTSLVQSLVSTHESWASIPEIFRYLHRQRQDLLEPFLCKPKLTWRGGSSINLIDLLPRDGYQRYTLSQQTVLGRTLSGLIGPPSGHVKNQDVRNILRTLRRLALLPALGGQSLVELSEDKRPAVADAATRALGRLDGSQGLPALFTALGDARARIAICALQRSIADMPPERAFTELAKAPLGKVTVAKETARLMGAYGGAKGYRWLVRLAGKHPYRDVRIAILRALWNHLDQPESWSILRKAARTNDPQILDAVARLPAAGLSEKARRRWIRMLAGLAGHPDTGVRLTIFRRFINLPLPDPSGSLLRSALESLTALTVDEREAAARVIMANATPADAPAVARGVEKMLGLRRSLHDFTKVISSMDPGDASARRRMQPTARAMLKTLQADPLTAGMRLNLCAALLEVDDFARELESLPQSGVPLPAVATEAIAGIGKLAKTKRRVDLPGLEGRLAAAEDPNARVLAFHALVAQATDPDGWTETRRARLEGYRKDPSPIVAISAQFFFDADRS